MPENSTTAIAVNVDVDTYVASPAFGGSYVFSPQDSTVRFRELPANVAGVGLKITLPANPSDGDTYEFVDADGSCSFNNSINVIPDPGGTATIGAQNAPGLPSPLTGFAWANANAGGKFQFDAKHNQWLLWQSATGVFNATVNLGIIGSAGAVSPGNFAGGAAINLFGFLVNPSGLGIFTLTALVNMIVAAADAGVILAVSVVPNVTAFSGGTLVGGVGGAPAGRFETGTGAGQPVVVTGDAGIPIGQWIQQVATGDIGHETASLDLTFAVGAKTNPAALGMGILVTLADTAQAITGIKLNATVQEAATGA